MAQHERLVEDPPDVSHEPGHNKYPPHTKAIVRVRESVQTDRQAERPTNRQTDRETESQKERQIFRSWVEIILHTEF